MMLPEKFIQRIKLQEYINAGTLLKALEEPSPVSIRVNTLKWDRKPARSEQVPWCNKGYYLEERPSFTFDPLFQAGCYYPQEASGMFLEQVFSALSLKGSYIRVLDLCAAPGGKSTHLSSLLGDGALLVANDVIKSRADLLSDNITKWGIPNAIVTRNDPASFGKLTGFFDVILVDAPCSGEGMFRDRIAAEEWTEENAVHCSLRQKRIMMDVWPALKEDGIFIYSTCTFNSSENEDNIRWLLKQQEAEVISLDISRFEGITEIDRKGLAGYGFHPDRIRGEGLFISVLRKKGRAEKVPKVLRGSLLSKPTKDDLRKAAEWTIFDPDCIVRFGEELVMTPGNRSDYDLLSGYLKIIKPGTGICTVKNKRYLPSHELALSTGLGKNAFPVAELDYRQAASFLKRESIRADNLPGGWFIAVYRSVNIGFANNIGQRVNNYFPVGWRIRMDIPVDAGEKIIRWEED